MAACLRSLLLEYCDRILLCSDCGTFTFSLNSSDRPSYMLSSTVERFSGVKLSSGRNRRGETEYTALHYIYIAMHHRNGILVWQFGHSSSLTDILE